MNVEIMNMAVAKDQTDGTMAMFWCRVDGWAIHGCRISKAADGFLRVTVPRCNARTSTVYRRAVEPPREIWTAIVKAALAEYRQLAADIGESEVKPAISNWLKRHEGDDAGLRRVLCAGGKEVLAKAGI